MKLYFSKLIASRGRVGCLKEALNQHMGRSSENIEDLIYRSNEGKPFLRNSSDKISVSHTGNYWFGAFSDRNIGIDFELAKPRDIIKLAEHFFSKNEQEFINLEGEQGFYQIWTGKEAFVKHAGRGLFKSKIADNEMVYKQKDKILLKSKFKEGTMLSLESLVEELKEKGYIYKEEKLYGALFVEGLNLRKDYLKGIEIVYMDR